MRSCPRSVLLVVVLAASVSPAHADEISDAASDVSEVDYTIPSGPAFMFMRASTSDIAQPGTFNDISIEIAEGVGKDGQLQAGLAAGVRLSRLTGRSGVRGLELSTGVVQRESDVDDVTPVDLAAGLRWTVVDRGDAWGVPAFRTAVRAELEKCRIPASVVLDPARDGYDEEAARIARAQRSGCVAYLVEKHREAFEDEHWNDLRVEVGAAAGWRLPDTSPFQRDSHFVGYAAWGLVGGRLPICGIRRNHMLTGVAQVEQRHELEGTPYSTDLKVGARVVVGVNDLHLYVDLVGKYHDVDTEAELDFDWTAGVELRVYKKQWLALGVGNAFDQDDDIHVLGNFKWAISSSNKFKRPK